MTKCLKQKINNMITWFTPFKYYIVNILTDHKKLQIVGGVQLQVKPNRSDRKSSELHLLLLKPGAPSARAAADVNLNGLA
uniref:Uncharacterized protein n=1 Tax=Arundo donax TaxID=35708 RepID=A0A0A9DGY0_ARUDO